MSDIAADQAAARMLAVVRQLLRETHPGLSFAVSVDRSFERDCATRAGCRGGLPSSSRSGRRWRLPVEAALSQAARSTMLPRCGEHDRAGEMVKFAPSDRRPPP